ncbi:MAG: hypothetical protein ACTSRZ_03955 [Promethearchaeota archaeon]
MKKFHVITKQNCAKCKKLKDWFKKNNIEFDEWPIEEKWVADKLLHDKVFLKQFCDIDSCIVYTPLVYLEEEERYYYKELFGVDGLRENYIKNLLDI